MSTAETQLLERAQWNMNSYIDVLNKRVFGQTNSQNVECARSVQIEELLNFLHEKPNA